MKIPVYTTEQFEKMNQENNKPFEIEPGVYDFIIKEATEGHSKKGNEMITLKLSVNINGREISMLDWITLLPNDHESHAFTVRKIKDFLECIDLPYAEDSMQEKKLINQEGKVLLKLEYNKEKQRNFARVDMYMTEDLMKKYNHQHEKSSTETFDDDIPF